MKKSVNSPIRCDKHKEKAPTWLVVIAIVLAILITFLLLMTPGYKNWITHQIPDVEMRTICTGFIQAIVIALLLGFIFEYCIIHYDEKKQDVIKI